VKTFPKIDRPFTLASRFELGFPKIRKWYREEGPHESGVVICPPLCLLSFFTQMYEV
jgi:hypothetical protein